MHWNVGRGKYLQAVLNHKLANVGVNIRAKYANALHELETLHNANPPAFFAKAWPTLLKILDGDMDMKTDWEYNERLAIRKNGYNRNEHIDREMENCIGINSDSLEAIRHIYRQTLPHQIRSRDLDPDMISDNEVLESTDTSMDDDDWEADMYRSEEEKEHFGNHSTGVVACNEQTADAQRLNHKLIASVMGMSYTSMRRQTGAIK